MTPRLTSKLRGLETSGKRHSKDRRKTAWVYFGYFFAPVKIVASRGQKLQNFLVFREWRTSLRKTSIISETIIDRANPKTAFERELNSPSQYCRQIWPKVNRLASRGHQSKKMLFWAKSFTANNFFVSKDRANISLKSGLSRRDESNHIYFDLWKWT
jgi:hypothetical protein